jgi:hypothetical protein
MNFLERLILDQTNAQKSKLVATCELVGPATVLQYKACKEAAFPLCLERALRSIFGNESVMISLAERAGFKKKGVTRPHDIWDIYLSFLSALDAQVGKDAVAVIESKTLKDIEIMKCTQCPIYKIESARARAQYSKELPAACEFDLLIESAQ